MSLFQKNRTMFYAIFLNVFLLSCATVDNNNSSRPDWILHRHIEGKVCAVGSSLAHIKGFAYQQATAISRAIDQIAMQKSVQVNTTVEHFITGSSGHTASGLSAYSVQNSIGQTLAATVLDTWLNKKTGEFYVWMCTE